MASGFAIDLEKFEIYAKETAELYILIYTGGTEGLPLYIKFYYMEAILCGSWFYLLAIFQKRLKSLETFKAVRCYHSRTCSRKKNNEDIMNYLFISSDPT